MKKIWLRYVAWVCVGVWNVFWNNRLCYKAACQETIKMISISWRERERFLSLSPTLSLCEFWNNRLTYLVEISCSIPFHTWECIMIKCLSYDHSQDETFLPSLGSTEWNLLLPPIKISTNFSFKADDCKTFLKSSLISY